jgi:hypothetical protein
VFDEGLYEDALALLDELGVKQRHWTRRVSEADMRQVRLLTGMVRATRWLGPVGTAVRRLVTTRVMDNMLGPTFMNDPSREADRQLWRRRFRRTVVPEAVPMLLPVFGHPGNPSELLAQVKAPTLLLSGEDEIAAVFDEDNDPLQAQKVMPHAPAGHDPWSGPHGAHRAARRRHGGNHQTSFRRLMPADRTWTQAGALLPCGVGCCSPWRESALSPPLRSGWVRLAAMTGTFSNGMANARLEASPRRAEISHRENGGIHFHIDRDNYLRDAVVVVRATARSLGTPATTMGRNNERLTEITRSGIERLTELASAGNYRASHRVPEASEAAHRRTSACFTRRSAPVHNALMLPSAGRHDDSQPGGP